MYASELKITGFVKQRSDETFLSSTINQGEYSQKGILFQTLLPILSSFIQVHTGIHSANRQRFKVTFGANFLWQGNPVYNETLFKVQKLLSRFRNKQ